MVKRKDKIRKNEKSKRDQKPLLAYLRKTIANCKKGNTQLPDSLQFNELPRVLCTADGQPNKDQKSNVLKFYQKRYNGSVITSVYPLSGVPDIVIHERMSMINSSPPFGQHKSFIEYAIVLVRRWIIPYLSKKKNCKGSSCSI